MPVAAAGAGGPETRGGKPMPGGRTVQLLLDICCRCMARIASGGLLVVQHFTERLLTLALLQERRL